MNIITLTGRVGKDAESHSFENGGKIANFSLATTERWKGKDGEKKERTDWHNIVVGMPGLVSVAEKYIKKGILVQIVGMIRYREYEKDEQKRFMPEIHADRIELRSKIS